ncbi:MAG: hypothetical protein ABSC47_01730 [Terracidiphilus sp.]|jgi:hypothetical protein
MLDTLAGRLTWERTGQGMRVEIPARRSGTIVISVLWLVLWCGGGWLMLTTLHPGRALSHPQLLWLAGWAAGVFFMTASILWSLAGKTTLALDPWNLQIAHQVMGLQLNMRSYANADVRNLRFVPAMIRGRSTIPSGIWFEENGRTRRFATAVAETEASALIGKMLQVYKFSHDSTVY